MPSIAANVNDLAKLAGRAIDGTNLEELLMLAKAEYKDLDESTGDVKIELTDTNRPDLWCVEGIARQIRGGAALAAAYPFFDASPAPDRRIEVHPALETVRPFVAGFTVTGLPVTDDSLKGLIEVQEKLCESYGRRRKTIAIGVYNAERISWPVRYDGVAPGEVRFVPLGHHREMDLSQILDVHPKGVEYRWILEGLDTYPLLRDSAGLVLSFPPIINSRELGEVQIGDSDLFVEVTGTDIRSTLVAINIFACNLADRGGRVEPCAVVYPYDTPLGREMTTPRDHARPIDLDPAYLSGLLGVEAGPDGIAKVLEKYAVRCDTAGSALRVTPPPYRDDYMHPCDAVEDYAISAGYGAFRPAMPADFTVGKLAEATAFEDAVRDILTGFAFEEIMSNILTAPEHLRDKLCLAPGGLVEIENAMSRTFSVARDRVFPSLLAVESVSTKAIFPHRTFEVGEVSVLEGEGGALQPVTRSRAAALLADRQAGFSEIQSYMDLLLHYLGLQAELAHGDQPFFIPGRGAAVSVRGTDAGWIGEVHPEVLAAWGCKMPVALFELDLTALGPLLGPR